MTTNSNDGGGPSRPPGGQPPRAEAPGQARRRPRRNRRRGGQRRGQGPQGQEAGGQTQAREGEGQAARGEPPAPGRGQAQPHPQSQPGNQGQRPPGEGRRSRSRRKRRPAGGTPHEPQHAQPQPQPQGQAQARGAERPHERHQPRRPTPAPAGPPVEPESPLPRRTRRRDRDRLDEPGTPIPTDAAPAQPPPAVVEPRFLAPSDDDPAKLDQDVPAYEWAPSEKLFNIVSVRFSQGGLIEQLDAGDRIYERGDHVIVETEKGLQLAEVVVPSRRVMRRDDRRARVIRGMDPNDTRQERRNQSKEEAAYKLCLQLAHQFDLPMKLISVNYLHGGNRAVFYFSAEGRIDFRQLVRELAARLHTRIEMRQVGVRDASRHFGGVGPCGKHLCCSCFLQRFAPVSIRMAKDQNLVLNPQKVSGVCGRLMCCLTYEQKGYEALRKGLPKMSKRVQLTDGRVGRVRDIDVLRRRVRVQLEDGSYETVAAEDTHPPPPPEDPRASAAGDRARPQQRSGRPRPQPDRPRPGPGPGAPVEECAEARPRVAPAADSPGPAAESPEPAELLAADLPPDDEPETT